MKARFVKMYKELKANEDKIANDLISVQVKLVNLGGSHFPDNDKAAEVIRQSSILDKIVDES